MAFVSFVVVICTLLQFFHLNNAATDPMTRAKDMVQQMTLQEKFSLMAGVKGTYVGNTKPIPRLGIPAMKLQDGPQGFRTTDRTGGQGTSTAWPSALTMAASWDSDLIYRWAHAMGEEFRAKGANMHLGPGIGIARVPTAGRNFEYLSGEDPVLGASLVGSIVRGIQDNGVIANAKHYVNNEIEHHRMLVSANVDERTRFELYYPPFEAAVDAGVLSVMCAYNRINDLYACQNNDTLGHLRNDMGFEGYIVSDWTATKSTAKSLKATLDQEMPVGVFYSDFMLERALENGDIAQEDIDNSVTRILYTLYASGEFDTPTKGDPEANVTSEAHNAIAREAAAKSIVLLKNDASLLPINTDNIKAGGCIAVFGDDETIAGGGSGNVSPPYVITPAQGIQNALGANEKNIQVLYSSGVEDLTAAAQLAQQCDLAVVVVATYSSEGDDRESLSLPEEQNNLVSAVRQANAQTIVAVNCPGAILMPWIAEVSAVLINFYPGQEFGNAMADVLFGQVNPSARLPISLPNTENEVDFSKRQYPGVGIPPEAYYTEELLIGYRWYDAKTVQPLYEFGFGLSYTSFNYGQAKSKKTLYNMKSSLVTPLSSTANRNKVYQTVNEIDITLTNAGARDGTEIVQLYLEYPKSAREPPKQLKKFTKISLGAGETQTVHFTLSERDCAIWNVEAHSWEVPAGQYSVHVGASSRDIRSKVSFMVTSN